MSSIGKNIPANFLSSMWLAVLMLILTPLYVSFLGVESYGLIGFYLSWIAILAILDTGISATLTREIAWLAARPKEKEKIPSLLLSMELVYWGIILILGAGILAGASFFGASWFHTKNLSPELVREALMLMSLSLVVQVPTGFYTAGLIGLQRQVEGSGLLALFGTIRGFGAVIVLWKICPDIRAFFLWQALACLLQTGVMRWLLWRRVGVERYPARFSLEILQSAKGFAGGMFLITVLSVVITQADKIILSRLISLEALGFYMLAWAVASALSRVALPIIPAIGPRFTELFSKGDDEMLARQIRLASQLMNVLILPPAALIMFLSKQILFVWTGNHAIANGAGPILAIIVVGAVLSVCSCPALSVLYSKKRLMPVVTVNVIVLVVLLPLLIVTTLNFGAMGAAFCCGLYGLVLYIAYQAYGLKGLPKTGFFSSILRDFLAPCAASLIVACIAGYLLKNIEGKLPFVALMGIVLVIGWFAALLVCRDLLKTVVAKLKNKKAAVLCYFKKKGNYEMKKIKKGRESLVKRLLLKAGIFVMKVPRSGIYAENGMATIHNAECLKDSRFQAAYRRGIEAAEIEIKAQWKVYFACWAAAQAVRAGKGDFVECGVNRGKMSSSIMAYLDWNRLDRKFYLVDTFNGMCEKILSDAEIAAGYIKANRRALAQGEYVNNVVNVKKNFEEWSRAQIIQGAVPEVLKDIPESPMAFVHIDMNNIVPEKAAAKHFWPLMIKGGIMLLDDYAFRGYDLTKKGMDDFAETVGMEILSLPTGQGILIKS